MRALLFFVLFLGGCGYYPQKFAFEETQPMTAIDPDPMCHFKYSESSEELLEIMLSADPFDLYEDEYEIAVPYKVVVEVQQRQLPRESYTSQCPRL
jgi:hypothetical protein